MPSLLHRYLGFLCCSGLLLTAVKAGAIGEGPTAILNSNAFSDPPADGVLTQQNLSVAGDGNGGWVALWVSDSSPQGQVVSRSLDNGRTWSAPSVIGLPYTGVAVAASNSGDRKSVV